MTLFEQITGIEYTVEFSKCRKAENVKLRDFFTMCLLSKNLTLEMVGIIMNKKHCSLVHARNRFYIRIEKEPIYLREYQIFSHLFNQLWNRGFITSNNR